MRTTLFGLTALALVACGDDTGNTDDTGTDNTSGVDCSGSVCTLSGVITDDLTMTADKEWVLRGGVFIGDDENETVLTIEAGTTVYGESATDGMLVIRRHSKINAIGTAAEPIVFTSSKEDGTRARGDWGGLIINGRAPLNACAEGDGDCEAYGEGGTGWYGGDVADDSSGTLTYVRVEFAGTLISPDNELNGIAFQGVGSGTTVDYVQVHMNADDGVEFFGGTVNAKHLLITGAGDDSLDWTDGWTGNVQHVVLQQYSDASDNGIEADNNGDANEATPRSNPTLSNVTVIGSPSSENSDIGMLLREGTAGSIHNAIVLGFNDTCIDVDGDVSAAQVTAGALKVSNSILFGCTTDFKGAGQTMWDAGTGNSKADPMVEDAYNQTAPNFALKTGSPALTGAVQPAGTFFDAETHLGGVGATDWTAGWTISAAN